MALYPDNYCSGELLPTQSSAATTGITTAGPASLRFTAAPDTAEVIYYCRPGSDLSPVSVSLSDSGCRHTYPLRSVFTAVPGLVFVVFSLLFGWPEWIVALGILTEIITSLLGPCGGMLQRSF